MQKLHLLLLVGLLAFSSALGASSGARSAIPAGSTVTDVAMAQATAAFAASNNDASDDNPINGNPNFSVFHFWNIDGSLAQDGPLDPTGCQASLSDNCKHNAMAVAVSDDGSRVAVASAVSDSSSLVMVASRLQGEIDRANFIGAVTDMAMSDSGSRLVVGGSKPGSSLQDTDGHLTVYSVVGSDVAPQLDYNHTAGSIVDVDVNGGGSRIVAAGAGFHCGLATATQAETGSTVGNVQHVAISDGTAAWAVAGSDAGYFALFSERTSSSTCGREYQKRDVTSAIHAVAIREDASAFAVGNAAGSIFLYKLDPTDPDLVELLVKKDNLGDVRDLEFSGDGRYLAAVTGPSVRLLDSSDGLAEVFRDDRQNLVGAVGIDQRGEHLVAAAGSNVIVYDAIHNLVGSVPGGLVQDAGTAVNHTVSYRNDGNRAEQVQITFGGLPSGVAAQATPGQFIVQPGLTQSVDVRLVLDAAKAPGDLVVPIQHSLNGGSDGTGTTNLRVSVPTRHDLQLAVDGGASKAVQPAGAVAFTVNATNLGNVAETVIWQFSGAPTGWTVEATPASMTVGPGTTQQSAITIHAPATAPQLAQARITATASGGPSVILTATVGAHFGVALQAPPGRIIQEGVATSLDLTGTNNGNAPDTLRFKLGALPTGWQGAFSNGFAELQANDVPAGQSRTVSLILRAPEGSVSTVPTQVTVVLQSLGDTSQFQSRAILVTVEPATVTDTETSDDEGGGGGGSNGIPGPGPTLLLGVLGLAAFLRRRS